MSELLKPSLPGESRREYLARTCDHKWESHGGRGSGPCPIPVCAHCGTVKKTSYPDDKLKDLVRRFSEALLAKLIAAEMKYGWNNGWTKQDWESDCQRQLLEHVAKGDPLDVAAYAAFCWHHGWSTSQGDIKYQPWECAGRKQAQPEPGECDWPVCGCDPRANKVIDALQESGALGVKTCPDNG